MSERGKPGRRTPISPDRTGKSAGRLDVRLCALLVGGAGVVFVAESLARVGGGGSILVLPLITLVLGIASAVAIGTGNRSLRPGVLVVVVLIALVHMVILLGAGPVWTRAVSAALAASQMYALVLLNTKPVRAHFGLDS